MNYEIQGGSFPVVVCTVDANETMITEGGGMSWMTPNMVMATSSNGGLGKMLGRMVTKESLFQNNYTAQGGPGMIAFASSLPGEIMALEIGPGKDYVCQKSSFLASTSGVELSTFFQKKLGAGFFGGEGFIMQKLSGNGVAFVEIDGSAIRYNLQPGQQLIVDTGHVVLMSSTCQMDVQMVKGVKNVLFGGEGLFNTVVTGPGEVIMQTMPVPKLAGAIQPYIITQGK
ncbi:MAG: TIGR00266 family protein [Clostridiales bacterium]|nr:TIGR00266 family protein [Clostridia bacterium]MCR4564236.1 TIGR00266 family protein [Clostridiales bacterium]